MIRKRAIGPIGTIGRFIMAPVLIYFGFYSPLEDIAPVTSISLLPGYWDDLFIGIIALPLAMVAVQLTWRLIKNEPIRATGRMGFIINILITIFLFYTPLHHAMWFYLGFSLLVAATRGYAGCEVMAISNWLTGRNDQVGCVIFSPLDAIEKKIG
jgi:hypothetical protein